MDFDDELISKLYQISGELFFPIKDGECYIEILEENFPFRLGRIDWLDLPHHRHRKVNFEDREVAQKQVLQFLDDVKHSARISEKSEIILISDSALKHDYQLPFYLLSKCIDSTFFLPQHTYIIPPDASWCLNYTFENDLFFGLADGLK